MSDQPGSWLGRVAGRFRGEVPVAEVRARLRGGEQAYEDADAADRLRQDLVVAGVGPWGASPSETSQLLCAWNAYALQSLADAFVAAEEESRAGAGRGFVDLVTFQQVDLLAREIPAWSGRARRAAADPGYDVGAEVALPAPLNAWVAVEPCPPTHLAAMQAGAGTMLQRAQGALADFQRGADDHRAELAQLSGLLADVEARVTYAAQALGRLSAAVHESLEAQLRDTAGRCFLLGQYMARPRLLRLPSGPPAVAPGYPAYPQYPEYPQYPSGGGWWGHGHHDDDD